MTTLRTRKKESTLTKEQLVSIVSTIRARIEGVELVYIFGSRVSGNLSDQSDYDLALKGSKPIDRISLFNLKVELESLLDSDVDLLDLAECDTVTAYEIIRSGVVIYRSSEEAKHIFEMYAVGDYCRFNEERRLPLKQFFKRMYGN